VEAVQTLAGQDGLASVKMANGLIYQLHYFPVNAG
jgi:hypothetical protein